MLGSRWTGLIQQTAPIGNCVKYKSSRGLCSQRTQSTTNTEYIEMSTSVYSYLSAAANAYQILAGCFIIITCLVPIFLIIREVFNALESVDHPEARNGSFLLVLGGSPYLATFRGFERLEKIKNMK